ncbi:MAG TPA: Crp/Fnr family transcriptional regulator [Deinococcales bacterium]|nr:Crp/Fnr family transcriptional regulator [Deinococcales bacterium]
MSAGAQPDEAVKLAAVTASPLFAEAPAGAVRMATEAGVTRHFRANEVIFYENDEGEAVYLIAQGSVKISRSNLDGKERIFTILPPDEVLGEMALVSQSPRNATAFCLEPVTAVALYRDDLRPILNRYPVLLWNLAAILARRLAESNREVEILSTASTQACVAHALLTLYKRPAFRINADGSMIIEVTHQDLAARTGNSRETITRVLRDFEGEGIVSTRPGAITLLKPERLEEIIFGLRESD